MPLGTLPPLVIKYSASAIPVIQLGLSSATMSEQAVFDTAVNFLRPRLVTIPGVAIPWPFGGKQRVISVDLDTAALLAKGLTPTDVISAVNTQNLILPSGTAKIGGIEYVLGTNASPDTLEGLNRIPVMTRNGATTYLAEVAHVRDGFSPQTNIVRQNGERGVLVSVIKNGGTSTLDIVGNLLAQLPILKQSLPPDLKITPLFDQSSFVRAAISGVVREALIAAALTAALILLFLGNWRSTCIIAVSIPLSILCSIIALWAIGETLNLMTLGGLALAVGILVDDATVTIENIERHRHLGSDLHKAILEGAGEIAIPALVSTLCICIVFVPMFFLSGVARYLFAPLAEAVVFAMLASYLLSRTLVPTLVMLMMDLAPAQSAEPSNLLQRVYRAFDARFESIRAAYRIILTAVLGRRRLFAGCFMAFCLLSTGLVFVLGRDFFPTVDGGLIRLHMRLPSGTRIEQTARVADQVEAAIRTIVPARDLGTVLDNLGLPISGINLSYNNAGTIGSLDGEIQVSLNSGHRPTEQYIEQMRRDLPRLFPGVEFFYQPADMMTQILNFGLPAAIDVQITGSDLRARRIIRRSICGPSCPASAGRAIRWRLYSTRRAGSGQSAYRPPGRCSMPGKLAPTCASQPPITQQPWRSIGRPCSLRWRKSKTASPD
jgi:multidrug efflux pump subunit AcrB